MIHQTGTPDLKSTLAAFKSRKVSTHYVIEKGKVYQIADLDHWTSHMGDLKSRCMEGGSCSEAELKVYNAILNDKNIKSWSAKFDKIESSERAKKFPDRYPTNREAIGIEIVQTFDAEKKTYHPATPEDVRALSALVRALVQEYGIGADDVYAHGVTSRKEASEGVYPLEQIKLK